MDKSLSILIITYKEEPGILKQCLQAVFAQTGMISAETILINNGSDNISYLSQEFPALKLINNQENIGVARARNQAISLAKGENVLFIDSDIVPAPGSIEKMFAYLTLHADIDGLGAKLVYPSGGLQKYYGVLPTRAYLFTEPVNIIIWEDNSEGFHQVPFLGVGGVFMFRRAAWEKVGRYDENFSPYGWEDADWCLRARKKGVQLFYFPDSEATHFAHMSVRPAGMREVEFYLSGLYYYRKHFGKCWAFCAGIFLLGFSFLRILVSFIRPNRAVVRKRLFRLCKGIILRLLPGERQIKI